MKYRDKDEPIELPEIPEEFYRKFEALKKHINSCNQRPILKLNKIYKFMDLYAEFVATFAVCSKGCSYCCTNDIYISEIEAKYIEENSTSKIKRSLKKPSKGNKSPCPFLSENKCSIYKIRPFACRTLFTLDDPKYCVDGEEHILYGSNGDVYTVDFYKELDEIIFQANGKGAILDIRDFFG